MATHKWSYVIIAMALGMKVEYEGPDGWKEVTDSAVNPFSFPHWNWRVNQ